MIDVKGFGFSSGTRAGNFVLQDSHEQIGVMLKKFRTDKPAFLIGHSMGCMNIQTFLSVNPNVNLAGVIHSAPFFGFHPSQKPTLAKRMMVKGAMLVGEEFPLNPVLPAHWMCHDKTYWARLMNIDGTCAPVVSGGIVNSMMDSCVDINDNAKK